MAALCKSDPNISKVQNIIGSQKECLRASAVVNSNPPPLLSVGAPAVAAIVPLREGIGFFFFFPLSLPFFFSPWFPRPISARSTSSPAHRWADLIRTFLSDLFTMGRWLYL